MPAAAPETNGDSYLFADWSKANVYLKDSTMLSDLNVKIDLKDQMVEILHKEKIKVLPIKRILSMTVTLGIERVYFLNSRYLLGPENPGREELLEVVEDGEVLLLCKTDTQVLEANYNPVLNVGRLDTEIIKKKKYLIVKNQKVVDASLGKSHFRTEMVGLFGSDIAQMVKKVNIKDKEELVALVQALNKRG